MRTIKSTEELVQWAKEVNQGLTTKQKPDYQDYYAHSAVKDIEKWFIETNGDRKLILCSVYNTMAYEEVERLMLAWAKHKAQAIIDQEAEFYANEYTAKVRALSDRETAVELRERDIKTLETRAAAADALLLQSQKESKRLQDIVFEQQDRITALDAANEVQYKELAKMQAFRTTLRSILTVEQIS